MIPTYVVIPFLGKWDMTNDLVNQLFTESQGGFEQLFMLDNGDWGSSYPWDQTSLGTPLISNIVLLEWNLHAMFNFGIYCGEMFCRKDYTNPEFNVAILNNDISINTPHYIETLARALRSDPTLAAVCSVEYPYAIPDVVPATSNGTFQGNAMMLKGEMPFRFDDRFEWWYADTDFVAQIENAGYWVGSVPMAGHTHLHGGSQTVTTADIDYDGGRERDRKRWRNKWPQIPDGRLYLPRDLLMRRTAINPTKGHPSDGTT